MKYVVYTQTAFLNIISFLMLFCELIMNEQATSASVIILVTVRFFCDCILSYNHTEWYPGRCWRPC